MIALPFSAALVGASARRLELALAASATSSRADKNAVPSAGAAVTNYVTYVKGKPGKADPKKAKVYIVLGQPAGGQVVIARLRQPGAQLAVKYVNDRSEASAAILLRSSVLHQVERR